MAEIARKTLQLATAFPGDQLVASLLANQTNQVEYTLHTEFELPTKSKSVLSDDLAVGGWRWRLTVIIQLTQPSFTGTWAELGKKLKHIKKNIEEGMKRIPENKRNRVIEEDKKKKKLKLKETKEDIWTLGR